MTYNPNWTKEPAPARKEVETTHLDFIGLATKAKMSAEYWDTWSKTQAKEKLMRISARYLARLCERQAEILINMHHSRVTILNPLTNSARGGTR